MGLMLPPCILARQAASLEASIAIQSLTESWLALATPKEAILQQPHNPCPSYFWAAQACLFGEGAYATEACRGRAAGDDAAPCVGDSIARGGGDAARPGAVPAHEKRAALSLRSSACRRCL